MQAKSVFPEWQLLRSRLFWIALLLFFLPATRRVADGDCDYHMELRSLLPAQEIWQRMHDGEADAWKRPSIRGEPRIRKPPLLYWMNLLVWQDLDPEEHHPNDLLRRSRKLGAAMALLGLLAIAALGSRLYSPERGAQAMLVLMSCQALLKQLRLASYDTWLLGFCSAAAWMLVLISERTLGWRRWALAPLALLCCLGALFSKGPVGFLGPGLLILLLPLCFPRGRFNLLPAWGLMAICGVLYAGWLHWVLHHVPGAADTLRNEFTQVRNEPQPLLYYIVIIGVVFPWTLYAFRAVSKVPSLHRPDLFPWLILLLGILLLSFPDNKRQRYLIPLLPFFALGFVQLWERLRTSPGKWEGLHAGLFLLLSILLPVLLPFQTQLVALGWMSSEQLPGAGWLASVAAMLLLIPPAYMLWRATRRQDRKQMLLYTAVWFCLFYGFAMNFYIETNLYRYKAETERLRAILPAGRVYFAYNPEQEWKALDDRFIFHSGHRIHEVSLDNIPEEASALLIPADHPAPSGWKAIDETHSRIHCRLFVKE